MKEVEGKIAPERNFKNFVLSLSFAVSQSFTSMHGIAQFNAQIQLERLTNNKNKNKEF